jgi:type VI secretion system secreted protein Hcp
MAVVDMYLEITGLARGDAADAAVPDPSAPPAVANATVIAITGFELGADHAVATGSATGGAGAGKADLNPLTVTKVVDQSSPSLFSACVSGTDFPKVQLYVRQSQGSSATTFLAYEFQTVLITKIDWSGAAGSELPSETLTLDYAALVVAYKPADSAGSPGPVIQDGWNLATNTSDVQSSLQMT